MKIVTRLKIIGFFLCCLLVVSICSLYWAHTGADKQLAQEQLVDQVVRNGFDLNLLTNAYLFNHSDRTRSQWFTRHKSLGTLFTGLHSYGNLDEFVMFKMERSHDDMAKIFAILVSHFEQIDARGELGSQRFEQEERFSNQLLIKSQAVITNAQKLNKKIKRDLATAHDIRLTVIVGAFSLFAIVLFSAIFEIIFSVIRPLKKFNETVESLGRGEFNRPVSLHRGDEIGDLSRKFDQMITDLAAVTVSRDDLLVEMNERRKVEDRFRTLFDKAPVGYQSLDENGIFIEANDTLLEQLGYEREEVIGKSFGDFLPPEWRIHFREKFPRFKAVGEVLGVEFEMVKKDGSILLMSIDGKTSTYPDGSFKQTHCVLSDITDRQAMLEEKKTLEERLRQSQKMEAVGTMAGGIAHDFNNILAIILGNAELARDDLDEDTPARQCIDDLLVASLRGASLVKQILAFSRKEKVDLIPILPIPLIKETVKLLRSTTPTTVSITEEISEKCGMILAVPTQLHQLLVNLFANGIFAVQEKGQITVGLAEVQLRRRDFGKLPIIDPNGSHKPGCYVRLTVSDDGLGMDDAEILRIFDPFYTTKEVGEGTGMGLSVVHGIVESHGGFVTVESTLGVGTTFQVFFPVTETEDEDRELPPDKETGGDERILIVDDEERILKMAKRMLAGHGYLVVTESDSLKALELFRKQPEFFDLIITDQSMPNMSGTEFISKVLQVRPGFPSIVCSGFSSKISDKTAKQHGVTRYMDKPYGKKRLLQVVREVLDVQQVH